MKIQSNALRMEDPHNSSESLLHVRMRSWMYCTLLWNYVAFSRRMLQYRLTSPVSWFLYELLAARLSWTPPHVYTEAVHKYSTISASDKDTESDVALKDLSTSHANCTPELPHQLINNTISSEWNSLHRSSTKPLASCRLQGQTRHSKIVFPRPNH